MKFLIKRMYFRNKFSTFTANIFCHRTIILIPDTLQLNVNNLYLSLLHELSCQILLGLLLEDEARGEGQVPGILQDWLDLLDPTVLSSHPTLQTQLVFAKEGEGRREGKRTKSSRPYLLSLLTHQVILRLQQEIFLWSPSTNRQQSYCVILFLLKNLGFLICICYISFSGI